MKKTVLQIILALSLTVVVFALVIIALRVSANDVPYGSSDTYNTKAEFDAAFENCEKMSDGVWYAFDIENNQLDGEYSVSGFRTKGGWKKPYFSFFAYNCCYTLDGEDGNYIIIEAQPPNESTQILSQGYTYLKDVAIDEIECKLYYNEEDGYLLEFCIDGIMYNICLNTFGEEEVIIDKYEQVLLSRYVLC